MLAPVQDKTQVTLSVATNLGALAVVPPGESPEQKLAAALANVAKLETSFAAADRAQYVARTYLAERLLLEYPLPLGAALVGIPAMMLSGKMYAIGDHIGVFAAPLLASAVGGFAVWGARELCTSLRNEINDPVTTSELSGAANLLAEMSDAQRAQLKRFAEEAIKKKVEAGRISSPAAEHLTAKLAVESADPADVRAGRVALLVRDLETDPKPWEQRLETIFADYPVHERRSIADFLLKRLFKNEKCTLDLEPARADELYQSLRATQRATE